MLNLKLLFKKKKTESLKVNVCSERKNIVIEHKK